MPNKIKYPAEDLIGKKFERLYITGPEVRTRNSSGKLVRQIYANCDCGNKHVLVNLVAVASGKLLSCGCLQELTKVQLGQKRHSGEIKSKGNTSHGDSKPYSPYYGLHSSWNNMRNRCRYECCSNYEWYGGKGIRVCEEWDKSYQSFKDWALSNGWEPGLEIDRIDNDKDYCPENCRWRTRKEQNNNSSHNVRATLYGTDLTISQWSEVLGVNGGTIRAHIYRGETPEEAVNYFINPNKEVKKPFIFIPKEFQ